MDVTIPSWILYLSGVIAVCSTILTLFRKADEDVSKEKREKAAAWIRDQRENIEYSWPSVFVNAFDNVFGNKHFTFKCFIRSAFASFSIALIAVMFLFDKCLLCFDEGPFGTLIDGFDIAISLFIVLVIINIFFDYFSLLQTRFTVGVAKNSKGIKLIFVIVADILLSIFIFLFAYFFYISIYWFSSEGIFYKIDGDSYIDFFLDTYAHNFRYLNAVITGRGEVWVQLSSGMGSIGFNFMISLITSMFTSIWLYILIIGRFAHRLFKEVFPFILFVDSEEKPLTAIGWVSVFLVISVALIGSVWSMFIDS